MKILFLQFPLRPDWGGAETHTRQLICGFAKAGNKSFLLTSNPKLLAGVENVAAAKKIFFGWEPTSAATLLLFPLTFAWGFFSILTRLFFIRPDVVFCLSLSDKLVCGFIKFFTRTPVVWIEHTRIGNWLYASPLRYPYLLLSKKTNIVCPSFFLRNQLIKLGVGIDRIKIIYPGTAIANAPVGGIKKNPCRLGFLGRLSEEKGLETLLSAMEALPRKFSLAIGGGDITPRLADKIASLQSSGIQVKLLGNVKNLRNFFDSIGILVVPSIKPETFGLVAIEAFANSTPVIASRTGALPEIIENKKNGLLFEPGNADDLKKTAVYLAENPGLLDAFIQEGRASVLRRFDNQRMVSDFERLIDKIKA